MLLGTSIKMVSTPLVLSEAGIFFHQSIRIPEPRHLMSKFRLPGEAQQIDRILEKVVHLYIVPYLFLPLVLTFLLLYIFS